MHNLIKKYPALLDLKGMDPYQRELSLKRIYERDIIDDEDNHFREKKIYPVKTDNEIDIERNFDHLTTGDIEHTDRKTGRKFTSREFEPDRSLRLHWIKTHLEEGVDDLLIFSCSNRDRRKRKDVIRTLIYNRDKRYVIILEPQRTTQAYYLVTAYYLNKSYGKKEIEKMYKRRLDYIG